MAFLFGLDVAALSFKQLKFIAAYIGEAKGNATEAARLAGYKGSNVTLGAVGAENLKKPLIMAAIDAERNRIVAEGIAHKQNRIDAANRRHQLLQRVIDERAEDNDGEAPGKDTGLLVQTFKALGSGPLMTIVAEYAVDTGLLREMRELEKQVAQEMGQWVERNEHTGPDGGAITVSMVRIHEPEAT